ncbi:MAG: DUF6088 family protein [Neptuniibacter sp.]
MNTAVTTSVESYIKHRRKGEAITREQILSHVMASEPAVDQAISRIAKAQKLTRITAGVYVRPKESRFGELPPSIPSIIKSLEQKHKAVIVPAGAKAANELGLSTQLPMQLSYVSNKRITQFYVGKKLLKFEYKKALPEKVSHNVALLYSAMSYIGKTESVKNFEKLESFYKRLNNSQQRQFELMTSGKLKWMHRLFKEEANGSVSKVKQGRERAGLCRSR